MPEFEMPAGVEQQASNATTEPARPAHTAEPDASDPHGAPRRGGLNWRHVLIGVVVGVVVGAAIPAGVQLAERSAASADSDSLRAVATDYLTAIAEGRAADATALAPLPRSAGDVPDAVLQSAERIQDAGVRMLQIDGDVGTVEVRYDVGRGEITRSLEAERIGGEWQLTSSLAEGVAVQVFSSTTAAHIAGFRIPVTTPVHLYPGTYRFDDTDDPMLQSTGEPFLVDGDTGTRTETYYDMQLAPEVAAHAGDIGVAVAEQCRTDPGCRLPVEGEVEYGGGTWVQLADDSSADVSVQLMVGAGTSAQWFESRMRILRDATGEPTEWLCAKIDDYDTPTEPCPEVE